MCGIFGAVGDDVTRDDVAAMGASLAHRGPDDDGLQAWAPDGVVFGHTRLAIFDLTAAGRNPLANEDGTVWVTFNGVIYNARELRADLEARGHVFRSRTDTEVLVHAYEEWADDHVTRVRGMFAYALYDRRRPGRRGRVLVVRDRLGIKPLYYYAVGGRFVFASELGAIRSFPRIDSSADYSAIADYLTYRYIPAPKTPARHIRKLPPATCLVLDADDSIRLRRYWTLAVSPRDELRTAETAFDALRSTLESAVARHLAGDVDVGILLSGGIDSSGIAALAAQLVAKPMASFTIGFDEPGKDDIEAARTVARLLGTEHHEGTTTVRSMEDTLPVMARMYSEPFADGSAIPTRDLCRLASGKVKVVLSGDGGDELFGGYTHYRQWLLRQLWYQGVPAPLRRLVAAAGRPGLGPETRRSRIADTLARQGVASYAALLELFLPREKRLLAGPALAPALDDADDHWLFRQYWRDDLDALTRLQYVDLHTFLVDDILTKVDRASMSFGLEVRPVLLDDELVELAFAIPARVRSGALGLGGKRLLKRVLRARLPPPLLARPKSGFGAPLGAWLARSRDRHLRGLMDGPLVTSGLVSRQGLQRLASRLHGLRLWALLVLERCVAAEHAPAMDTFDRYERRSS